MKNCCVIFMLCFSSLVCAQEIRISPISSEISKEEVQEIKQRLSFQKNFFRKQLIELPTETIEVKVFGNYADFSLYAIECCRVESFTTALYNGNKNEIVVFKNEEFVRSVSHEITHALIKNTSLENHLWLSEGLAEVMSSYKPIGLGDYNEERLYFAKELTLNQKSTKKLIAFLDSDVNDWRSLNSLNSYGVSWALVNYLYKTNPMLLRQVIRDIEDGIGLEVTMAERYKKGLKEFIKSFRDFYVK